MDTYISGLMGSHPVTSEALLAFVSTTTNFNYPTQRPGWSYRVDLPTGPPQLARPTSNTFSMLFLEAGQYPS